MDSVQSTPANSLDESHQNGGYKDFGGLNEKLLDLGLEGNADIKDHDEVIPFFFFLSTRGVNFLKSR